MTSIRHVPALLFALSLALAGGGCSSSSNNPSDGGHGGSGGGSGGTGGTGGGGTGGASGAGGTGGAQDGSAGDAGQATMTLTSTALAEGAAFAADNSCAGANTSPPLTWTGAPSGTMSYAVSLTDMSISAVHWVIWDIPSSTTALPAGLPGDTMLTTPVTAKQRHLMQFFGAGGAYKGPCPPAGSTHNYQFQVNAIPTATLAGATVDMDTPAIMALVLGASLAHGNLDGTATTPAATDAGGQ